MKRFNLFQGLVNLILTVCLISGCSPAESQFVTPTVAPSLTPPATMTLSPTLTPSPFPPTATPIIEPGLRIIVEDGIAKGITVGALDLAEFTQVIPVEWLTEQQVPPRYEMRITPLATFITECKYEPTGVARSIRVDIDVSITDLEDNNKLIGDEHFKGYPPACPLVLFLKLDGSTKVLGLPTIREFKHWVFDTIRANTKLPAPAAGVSSLALLPDGKTLVFGGEDGTVKFIDMASMQVLKVFTGHQDEVLNIATSSDGKLLASASRDGTAKLWDIATGMELDNYPVDISSPTLVFSADGKMLAVRSSEATVHSNLVLWDTSRRGKAFGKIFVDAFAFSPDGITYATYDWKFNSKGFWVREILTEKDIQFLETDIPITAVAYSPDGKVIALGEGGNQIESTNKVRFLNADTLQEILTLDNLEYFEAIAFSPDGAILATRNKQFISLWDVSTGRELQTFGDSWFTSLVFSPDGKTVLTGSWTGVVTLWDLATGDKLAEFKNTFYVQ